MDGVWHENPHEKHLLLLGSNRECVRRIERARLPNSCLGNFLLVPQFKRRESGGGRTAVATTPATGDSEVDCSLQARSKSSLAKSRFSRACVSATDDCTGCTEYNFTLLPRSGSRFPGNVLVSSRITRNNSADFVTSSPPALGATAASWEIPLVLFESSRAIRLGEGPLSAH